MNRPHPVEVAVPALMFTVAGWLIGGSVFSAVVGALFGLFLGVVASGAGHRSENGRPT